MTVVLMTILTAFAATPAPVIPIRKTIFPTVMFRTVNPVWTVTEMKKSKSSPTPATDLWIAAASAANGAPKPVCREQQSCMTTANPAPTAER